MLPRHQEGSTQAMQFQVQKMFSSVIFVTLIFVGAHIYHT